MTTVTLDKNTLIPTGAVLVIAAILYHYFGVEASAKAAADSAASAHAEIKKLQEADRQHEAQMAEIRVSFGSKLASFEAQLASMNQAVGRIEGKLDAKTDGTVNAGGRR